MKHMAALVLSLACVQCTAVEATNVLPDGFGPVRLLSSGRLNQDRLLRNGNLSWNAASDSLIGGGLRNAEVPASSGHASESDPTDRDRNHVPLVFGQLLGLGSPSTIAALVIPVGINPVDRMSWAWSPPHVGQKSCEAIVPLARYSNASPAISHIVFTARVEAAKFNSLPYPVLGHSSHSVRSGPFPEWRWIGFQSSQVFLSQATARPSGSFQIGSRNMNEGAAYA